MFGQWGAGVGSGKGGLGANLLREGELRDVAAAAVRRRPPPAAKRFARQQQEEMPIKIAVIGAGPIGLESALAATLRGDEVVVFERGDEAASGVRSWGHVRLFSSNEINLSRAGRDLMRRLREEDPGTDVLGDDDDAAFPTGAEYRARYLLPMAAWLGRQPGFSLRCGAEVVGVGRGRLLKQQGIVAMGSEARRGRGAPKFRLMVCSAEDGSERVEDGFDAVLDCSGTFGRGTANHLGVGGLPAIGERALRNARDERLVLTLPDIASWADDCSGRRVCVVGAGYSAATCIAALQRRGAALQAAGLPGMELLWITRRAAGAAVYERIEDDPLPQRDELCVLANGLAGGGQGAALPGLAVRYIGGAQVSEVAAERPGAGLEAGPLRLSVDAEDGEALCAEVDVVLCCCGFRPDLAPLREVQLHVCYASEGPMKLAASLLAAQAGGAGGGDCLKQASAGPDSLRTPEPGLFLLGMKSYGRNSSFLLRIGHAQVEEVMGLLPVAGGGGEGVGG